MQKQLICLLISVFTVFILACNSSGKQVSDQKEVVSEDVFESQKPPSYIFVGTYTRRESHVDGKAEGIYLFEMDPDDGTLSLAGVNREIVNPSFLAISPDRRHLYAVNEIAPPDGPNGTVSAFEIETNSYALNFLNMQSTHGFAPCHLNMDDKGKCLLVANYLGGAVSVFKLSEEGYLSEATDIQTHEGSGPHAQQKASHPHSVVLSPDSRFAFVPDKGTDKIMIYELMPDQGKLEPATMPFVQVQPGAGPRHFVFHPKGHFAYVINELDGSINAFEYDYTNGSLKEIQRMSTLPKDFQGFNACADIHLSPDGKFLYGSNRGHDSIVAYSVNESSGELKLIEHEPVQGIFPRNFMIDRSGSFLYVANQNTDNIVAFRINKSSGELDPTGFSISCPTPVCMVQL